ncbi:ras-related and estrogen-regulated growth inhibitor-like isoform X2 [Montipora capricornis]|uniref:ras-related and estrogen-regulated growth inhibitor-like isoform X2 n=1 Tax=Montipora capricornis TaxID=246305 RepID=UPI0035F1DB82
MPLKQGQDHSTDKDSGRQVMKNRRKLSSQAGPRNIRIAVLGQDGVGKTALTVRFLTRRFIGEYDQTLETTTRHHVDVDGEFVALDILDTAGKNTDEKLDYIIGYADIFLVLYSVTDRASFQEAGKIAKYIRRYRTLDSSSIIITGTKTDLEHFRTVRETDGSRLTYSLNCGFYEISISENYGDTMNMFNDILRQYLSAHPGQDSLTIISPPHFPSSPLTTHKEIKSPSSWAKVKGLKTMPFRRKSVQTTA